VRPKHAKKEGERLVLFMTLTTHKKLNCSHAWKSLVCLVFCILTVLLSSAAVAQDVMMLVGTGSSLPAPLYHSWAEEFSKQHKTIRIRYLPIGTGDSVLKILTGSGDFGGGDAPIPEQNLKPDSTPVLELPMILIGIVVVYRVPGISEKIKLTGPALANIFLGKIKNWNDPEIAKSNPGLSLPSLAISIVHRTEGKGSNYIFADYLCKVSREFQTKVGGGTSPKWQVGIAVGRSEELVERVKNTPGAIGYTELHWALKSGLAMASIRNASGDFVNASRETIAAAASATENKMTEDFRISLTNSSGKGSYPISSFTWLYVPEKGPDPARTKALVTFLNWALTNGQDFATAKGYPALPTRVVDKVRAKVATLQ
jgi:phosphate transport system substrate-binding protein